LFGSADRNVISSCVLKEKTQREAKSSPNWQSEPKNRSNQITNLLANLRPNHFFSEKLVNKINQRKTVDHALRNSPDIKYAHIQKEKEKHRGNQRLEAT
jgi:hypothetical protein